MFSTSTWIGFIVAAVIGILFTKLFNTVSKPFKKKEFGLRCEEIRFSSSELDLLSESNFIDEKSTTTIKHVFVEITLRVSNTGKKDISKSDIYKRLKIRLPKPFKVVSVEIVKKNNKMSLKNSICDDNSSIVSEWDLLKRGDSFDLTILANAPKDDKSIAMIDSFYDSLEIEIFANDIDKVNKSQSLSSQSKLAFKFVFLLSLFFLGLLLLSDSKFSTELTPFRYDIQTVEFPNLQGFKQELQNCTMIYNPKTNSISLQNDSTVIAIPTNDFEGQFQVNNISIDNNTISVIHSHWLQHRIMMICAFVILFSSVLLLVALFAFNYFKNVK